MTRQSRSHTRLDRRVVTLTGGSGGRVLVEGLTKYIERISAGYTTFDNGGSTGYIRERFDRIAYGDGRQLLAALSQLPKDDPFLVAMNGRFESRGKRGTSFDGHSLGNLMMLKAEDEWGLMGMLKRYARKLNCRGEVIPVSIDKSHLVGHLQDGSAIYGETMIDLRSSDDERVLTDLMLHPHAAISPEAASRIHNAEYIILGPGDIFTSVGPTLLPDGMVEALRGSNGKIFFVGNLMTKNAESRGFASPDFPEILLDPKRFGIGRDQFDAAFINTGAVPEQVAAKYYDEEKAEPVIYDDGTHRKRFERITKTLILGDFVSKKRLTGDPPRVYHDGDVLARAIVEHMRSDPTPLSVIRRKHFILPRKKEHGTFWIIDIDDTLLATTATLKGDPSRVEHARLSPGAFSFVKQLIRNRCQFALVSIGNRKLQRKKLEVVGMSKIFRRVHIVGSPEDKHDCIRRLIKQSGLPKERIIVVGDRLDREIAVGQQEGCKTILVMLNTGKYSLVNEHPLFRAENMNELLHMENDEVAKAQGVAGPDLVVSSLDQIDVAAFG